MLDVTADPAAVSIGRTLAGARTVVVVPMVKEGRLIGALILPPGSAAVHRQADRAGHDLRRPSGDRDRERAAVQRAARNSLQQQTATADVLKVDQPFDVRSADRASTRWSRSAARLCDADRAHDLSVRKVDCFYRAECYGFRPNSWNSSGSYPSIQDAAIASRRALLERQIVHVSDVLADPEYAYAEARNWAAFARCSAFRCCGRVMPIGVITSDSARRSTVH